MTTQSIHRSELRQIVDAILSCDSMTTALLQLTNYFDSCPLIRSTFLAQATKHVLRVPEDLRRPYTLKDIECPTSFQRLFPTTYAWLFAAQPADITHTIIVAHHAYTVAYNPLGSVDFLIPFQCDSYPRVIQFNSTLLYILVSCMCTLLNHVPRTTSPDIQSIHDLTRWLSDFETIACAHSSSPGPRTPYMFTKCYFGNTIYPEYNTLTNVSCSPSAFVDALHAAHATFGTYLGTHKMKEHTITYTSDLVCSHTENARVHRSEMRDSHFFVAIDLTTQFGSYPSSQHTIRTSPFVKRMTTAIAKLPVEIRARILNEILSSTDIAAPSTEDPLRTFSPYRSFTRTAKLPINSPLKKKSPVYAELFVHIRHKRPQDVPLPLNISPHFTQLPITDVIHYPAGSCPPDARLPLRPIPPFPVPNVTRTHCNRHTTAYSSLNWS